MAHYSIDYSNSARTPKYNPQIHFGALTSVAKTWNKDPLSKKEILWPESYQSDIAIFSSTV